MTFSLRKAGFASGALALWGLVGCDAPESSTPVSDATVTDAPAAAEVVLEPQTAPDAPANPQSSGGTPEASPAAKATGPATADIRRPDVSKVQAAVAPQPRQTPQPPIVPASRPRLASRNVGGVQEITFDTVKFPMEKEQPFVRSLLTPEVLALDGQSIRIRGYIFPTFQQTGLTQFVLVRDNLECCFGPGAALFDCIVVEMKPGRSTDYSVRPVSVEGKFTLAELVNPDDGKHLAIYHLDGEKVQ